MFRVQSCTPGLYYEETYSLWYVKALGNDVVSEGARYSCWKTGDIYKTPAAARQSAGGKGMNEKGDRNVLNGWIICVCTYLTN